MPTTKINVSKLKAVALSNRDIASKLDVITVHITNGNHIQAMNEYGLLKQQVLELGSHLKTLCQDGK